MYPTTRKPRYIACHWNTAWGVSDRTKPLFADSIVGTYKSRALARKAARQMNSQQFPSKPSQPQPQPQMS